jgi:hypothetical protein
VTFWGRRKPQAHQRVGQRFVLGLDRNAERRVQVPIAIESQTRVIGRAALRPSRDQQTNADRSFRASSHYLAPPSRDDALFLAAQAAASLQRISDQQDDERDDEYECCVIHLRFSLR